MADWLAQWIARTPSLGLAPGTIDSYQCLTRTHLVPLFGDFLLSRLTRQDVRHGWLAMRAAGRKVGSVRNCYICLASALAEAVQEGLLEYNPAHGSTKRLWRGPIAPPKPILLMDECPRFLAAVNVVAPELEDLFELLLGTGVRIGEALGLQLDDLDARDRLTIRRSCTKGRVGPVKGRRERTIGVPPGVLARLRMRQAMLPGPWYFPSTRRRSKPWGWDYVARAMRAALALAGIDRHITLHGARHGFSTFVLEETGDAFWLSRHLGHHSIEVTVSTYGQAAKPERPDTLAALDRAIHPPPHRPGPRVLPFRRPAPKR